MDSLFFRSLVFYGYSLPNNKHVKTQSSLLRAVPYVLGIGCDVRKERAWKAQYRGKLARGRAKHGQSPGLCVVTDNYMDFIIINGPLY